MKLKSWLHVVGYGICLILLLLQRTWLQDAQQINLCQQSKLTETEHRLKAFTEWDCATNSVEAARLKQLMQQAAKKKSH
jgi:hypothetical protein